VVTSVSDTCPSADSWQAGTIQRRLEREYPFANRREISIAEGKIALIYG
jgi:hypothetical protein